MPLTSVTKDPQALTMTIVADFPVPQRALWEAYADPRQLEKFWGPPEWPATFLRHDMFPGGRSTYVMRGPDGATSAGYWTFLEVEAPHRFSVLDGFAGDDGEPNPDMPTMRMEFTFEETPTGSRLTSTTHFNSAEELDELLAMGMEEGTRSAMGQIDAILSDLREFAAGIETRSRVLSQTQVRFTRVIGGPPRDVWRAHHDPALLKRWLLGPDGWRMVTCEVAAGVGDSFRYEWEREGGGERFGFDGEQIGRAHV